MSPIPKILAGLPVMKKGTSLPTFTAISLYVGICKLYFLVRVEIIPAAFELPPPKPASIGMFFLIIMSKNPGRLDLLLNKFKDFDIVFSSEIPFLSN